MTLRFVSNLKFFSQNTRIGTYFRGSGIRCRMFGSNTQQGGPRVSKFLKSFGYIVGGALVTSSFLFVDPIGLTRKYKIPSVVAEGPLMFRDKFNFIADVAEVVGPSVVYVEIRDTRRFNNITGQQTPVSAGSGFVVRPDGLILTNAHVVLQKISKGSSFKIAVKLQDGRMFDAEIESVDKNTDLATLRIPIKDLPCISLGKSNNLMPGEFVLAMGSPLALTNTVTYGIISAYRKSEEIGMKDSKTVYVQTDASINNGNSGGPLLNIEGEAVGINSMNIIPGISFATPIDLAVTFLKEHCNVEGRIRMKKDAENSRYIGVIMLSLTRALLNDLRRTELEISPKIKSGILLQNILPESPAEK